jgi:hypothetical protein
MQMVRTRSGWLHRPAQRRLDRLSVAQRSCGGFWPSVVKTVCGANAGDALCSGRPIGCNNMQQSAL